MNLEPVRKAKAGGSERVDQMLKPIARIDWPTLGDDRYRHIVLTERRDVPRPHRRDVVLHAVDDEGRLILRGRALGHEIEVRDVRAVLLHEFVDVGDETPVFLEL